MFFIEYKLTQKNMNIKYIVLISVLSLIVIACSGSGKVIVSDSHSLYQTELSGVIHLFQYSASGRDSTIVDLRGTDIVLRDSTNFEIDRTKIGINNDFIFRSDALHEEKKYTVEFININTFIIEIVYRQDYELHLILNNDGLMNITDRRIERRGNIGNPPIIE